MSGVVLSNAPIEQDILIARNSTFDPTCVLTAGSPTNPLVRTPKDLTGAVLTFLVKPTNTAAQSGDPDSNAVLTLDNGENGGITLADDPTTGVCYIVITPTQLNNTTIFPEGVAQFYALRVVDSSSLVSYPFFGNFTVQTYVFFDS